MELNGASKYNKKSLNGGRLWKQLINQKREKNKAVLLSNKQVTNEDRKRKQRDKVWMTTEAAWVAEI